MSLVVLGDHHELSRTSLEARGEATSGYQSTSLNENF